MIVNEYLLGKHPQIESIRELVDMLELPVKLVCIDSKYKLVDTTEHELQLCRFCNPTEFKRVLLAMINTVHYYKEIQKWN